MNIEKLLADRKITVASQESKESYLTRLQSTGFKRSDIPRTIVEKIFFQLASLISRDMMEIDEGTLAVCYTFSGYVLTKKEGEEVLNTIEALERILEWSEEARNRQPIPFLVTPNEDRLKTIAREWFIRAAGRYCGTHTGRYCGIHNYDDNAEQDAALDFEEAWQRQGTRSYSEKKLPTVTVQLNDDHRFVISTQTQHEDRETLLAGDVYEMQKALADFFADCSERDN